MSRGAERSPIRLSTGFTPPLELMTQHFKLRPLTTEHTERDFDAVMETRERLQASAANGWPRPGFTLAENRADLERHQQEFEAGIAFAYTVLNQDESRVLGCVYLNPPSAPEHDVDVHMWVRETLWTSGLAQHLHRQVDAWLRSTWAFSRICYRRPDYYFAKGGCLCGSITYYAGPLTGPFELCHCSRCRRTSGSAFVAGICVGDVIFIQGADLVQSFTLPVSQQPPPYRSVFCRQCGSPVPDPAETGPREIAAGSLQPQPVPADRHIYVEFTPPWAPIADSIPQYTAADIRAFRETGQ